MSAAECSGGRENTEKRRRERKRRDREKECFGKIEKQKERGIGRKRLTSHTFPSMKSRMLHCHYAQHKHGWGRHDYLSEFILTLTATLTQRTKGEREDRRREEMREVREERKKKREERRERDKSGRCFLTVCTHYITGVTLVVVRVCVCVCVYV